LKIYLILISKLFKMNIHLYFLIICLMDNLNSHIKEPDNILTIKAELEEMGFLTEHIDLAVKLSNDREEIINM
jgi:hypothetical protein